MWRKKSLRKRKPKRNKTRRRKTDFPALSDIFDFRLDKRRNSWYTYCAKRKRSRFRATEISEKSKSIFSLFYIIYSIRQTVTPTPLSDKRQTARPSAFCFLPLFRDFPRTRFKKIPRARGVGHFPLRRNDGKEVLAKAQKKTAAKACGFRGFNI